MSYKVYTSDFFVKELKNLAKKYPSIKNDFEALSRSLSDDPAQGQPLGRDCFKVRMAIASKAKGKSGGSRVISCVKIVAGSVYLLSIYDKAEKESITDKEIDRLLKSAGLL